LQLRTQVRNNRSSAARVCPAAPPHGIDVRPSRVTADARRTETPGTSPEALALRVPTPHNKYVAGSAPAARALRPTWPSSVCGSNTGCRVFSDRRLVALWWWATSATSERYRSLQAGFERVLIEGVCDAYHCHRSHRGSGRLGMRRK